MIPKAPSVYASNDLIRYSKVVQWARARYTDGSGKLAASLGRKAATYLRIEMLAFLKYVIHEQQLAA